jgi:PST family polysaccharide transporter
MKEAIPVPNLPLGDCFIAPPEVPDSAISNLGRLVRRGAAWTALNVVVSRFGTFLLGAIIARLVSPAEFGVFAVALVVHAVLINASELGVSTALLRGDQASVERRAPTVTTIALATSALLTIVMVWGSSPFARLLGAPHAAGVISVLALTVALAGIGAVPTALLTRDFRNDLKFAAEMSSLVVGSVSVLLMAHAGWGPMALAWSRVLGQVAATVVLLVCSPKRYLPGLDQREVRPLLGFGVPLAGANMLSWAAQNVDYVVIGRLLGSQALGLYVLAFNMSGWPSNTFSSIVRSVSLPAFVRLQAGGQAGVHFLAATRKVATLTFPVALFLGALAHPLVTAIYGPKWGGAVSALAWLALFGAFRTIVELFADFVIAAGRTRQVMMIQVLWLVTLAPAMIICVRMAGISGAGAAHTLVISLVVLPVYMLACRPLGVEPAAVVRSLTRILGWATCAAVCARLVSLVPSNPWLALLAGGSAGMALYLVPLIPPVWRELGGLRGRRGWRLATLASALNQF